MLVRLLSPAAGCSLRLLCPGSGDGVGSSTSPRCPFCSGKQLFWQQQQGTGSPAWEVPPALPAPLSLQSSQRKGMGLVVHKVVTEHPTLIPGICTAPQVCTPILASSCVCVHEQTPGVQAHTSCAHLGTYSGCTPACPSGDTWGGSETGGGYPGSGNPGRDGGGGNMERESGMERKARIEGEVAAWQVPEGQGG